MHLEEAKCAALELMSRHGLDDWDFGFDGAKVRLGACWLRRKRITLSRHFVELNDRELVFDVILHEIAHALTPGDGHGRRFKRKALELGCNGFSCVAGDRVVAPPPRVILECPHCGRSWPRYRKPARKLSCRACLDRARFRVLPLIVHQAAHS